MPQNWDFDDDAARPLLLYDDDDVVGCFQEHQPTFGWDESYLLKNAVVAVASFDGVHDGGDDDDGGGAPMELSGD